MSDNCSEKNGGNQADVLGNLPSLECLNKIARTTKNKASFNHFEKKAIKKRNLAFFMAITCFAVALFAFTIKPAQEPSVCATNAGSVIATRTLSTAQANVQATTQDNTIVEEKIDNNIANETVSSVLGNSQNIAQTTDYVIEDALAEDFYKIGDNNSIELPEMPLVDVVATQQNDYNPMHIELPEMVSNVEPATIAIAQTDSQNNLDHFKISLSPLSDSGIQGIDDLDIGVNSKNNNFLENILLGNNSAIARDSFDSQEENFIESQIGSQFSFKRDAMFMDMPAVDSSVQTWLGQQKIQGVAYKGKNSCIVLNSKIFHVGDLINNDLYVVWSDIDPESRLLYFVDGNGAYYAAKY